MNWFNFIYTDTGRMISCFIIGLGLSVMLRSVCNDAECIIIKGHSIEDIANNIFKFDDKCYSYKAVVSSCK